MRSTDGQPRAFTIVGHALRTIGANAADALLRPTRSLPPLEPLELDPVRLDGGVAEAALLVLLVILEVALEPLHVAVALEGQYVGGHAVEEEAVVADHDGAAGEILERRLERR